MAASCGARRGAARRAPRAALLWLCVAATAVAVSRATLPEPYASIYHTTDDIEAQFAALAAAHPDVMTWQPPVKRGGADTLGVATFGAATAPPDAPNILLVFGEHAREIITSDTALWLARALAGETQELDVWPEAVAALAATRGAPAGAVAAARAGLPLRDWARALLSHVTITIVPIEVPDARRAVEAGALCRRKSLSEVDLNRNWGVAWRRATARGADEYGGGAPFSEPQSRALRDLAAATRPAAYANVHSGEWAIYVPWDHKMALAAGLPADTPALVETLNTHCKCTRGAGGAASNYLAFGTSMDWMWQELGVPYSLTFELYGWRNEGRRPDTWQLSPTPQDADPAPADARRRALLAANAAACLPMFNPDTRAAYQDVVAGWVHNFLLLAEHVAAHAPRGSGGGNATRPAREGLT